MIGIQENKINERANSSPQCANEGWNKYNKRMDDMIDDAEIEAEMEAEKKIRSKNSRLFTISVTGIILLALIFINTQQHSSIPQTRSDKKPSVEKANFIPRKPQLINSLTSQSDSETAVTMTKVTKTSVKSKNGDVRVSESSTSKNIGTEKAYKPTSIKQTIDGSGGKHYVQLGAFSIKKNAEKFADKVKLAGFNTVISIRDIKSIRHQVFIGNFSRKNNSEAKQADLKTLGFTSFIEKINNAYTLDMGTFRNNSVSNSLVEDLRDQGFNPKTKIVSGKSKSYTVRIEGFETESAAQKIRQKLADQGFKNSFIR